LGSQIGNSLKTVFSRLGRAKSGDASVEEVNASERAYKQVGIDLRDQETGQFREIPLVLDELSTKWDKLTSVQKAYITEVNICRLK
jgi:TP901 family phage tail tape measure protein